MIKTARLNLPFKANGDMRAVLEAGLAKAGVQKSDFFIGDGEGYGENRTHFGNWCLVPVLDNEAAAKVAAALGSKLDYQQSVFEAEDLKAFKVGDKVSIDFVSGFGFRVKSEGKVHSISDSEIAIIKKGSRSGKGWRLRPGDTVTIEKIATNAA